MKKTLFIIILCVFVSSCSYQLSTYTRYSIMSQKELTKKDKYRVLMSEYKNDALMRNLLKYKKEEVNIDSLYCSHFHKKFNKDCQYCIDRQVEKFKADSTLAAAKNYADSIIARDKYIKDSIVLTKIISEKEKCDSLDKEFKKENATQIAYLKKTYNDKLSEYRKEFEYIINQRTKKIAELDNSYSGQFRGEIYLAKKGAINFRYFGELSTLYTKVDKINDIANDIINKYNTAFRENSLPIPSVDIFYFISTFNNPFNFNFNNPFSNKKSLLMDIDKQSNLFYTEYNSYEHYIKLNPLLLDEIMKQ